MSQNPYDDTTPRFETGTTVFGTSPSSGGQRGLNPVALAVLVKSLFGGGKPKGIRPTTFGGSPVLPSSPGPITTPSPYPGTVSSSPPGASMPRTNWLRRLVKNPDTLRAVGDVLGNAGKGSADQRTNDNRDLTNRYQALSSMFGVEQGAATNALNSASDEATSRYGTRQNATSRALEAESDEGLKRSRLGMDAGGIRARQSILGSLMQNMQPVNIEAVGQVRGNVPRITGGLTPATLDALTRQQGGALMNQALQAQLTGSDVPAATDFRGGVLAQPAATNFQSGRLKPPPMPGYANAGVIENAAGMGGTLASLVAAILGSRTPPVVRP